MQPEQCVGFTHGGGARGDFSREWDGCQYASLCFSIQSYRHTRHSPQEYQDLYVQLCLLTILTEQGMRPGATLGWGRRTAPPTPSSIEQCYSITVYQEQSRQAACPQLRENLSSGHLKMNLLTGAKAEAFKVLYLFISYARSLDYPPCSLLMRKKLTL